MEHEVENAGAAWATAVARGDAASAAALYTADARLLAPAAEFIAGPGEIEAYWQAGIALGLSGVELETLELDVIGPVAVEIGRYAALVVVGGPPVVDRGTYLVLHRRQDDGSWRRAVEVFNPKERS